MPISDEALNRDRTDQDRKIDFLSDHVMTEEHPVVDLVYIDIDAVLDIRMGALLDQLSKEEEEVAEIKFEYIMEKAMEYGMRFCHEISDVFPALSIDENKLLEGISTIPQATSVMAISPLTVFFDQLTSICGEFQDNRKIRELEDTKTRVILNNRYCPFPETEVIRWSHWITSLFGSTEITFTNSVMNDHPADFFNDVDMAVVMEQDEFFNRPDIAREMFEEGNWAGRYLLCPRWVTPKNRDKVTMDNVDEISLNPTREFLNIFSNFEFFTREVKGGD